MNDRPSVEEMALAYVDSIYQAAAILKPEASIMEVEGWAYSMLTTALQTYAEQLPNSSTQAGTTGLRTEPEQVQGTGSEGRPGENGEGIRQEPTGSRTSRRKKRRSKKTT